MLDKVILAFQHVSCGSYIGSRQGVGRQRLTTNKGELRTAKDGVGFEVGHSDSLLYTVAAMQRSSVVLVREGRW